MRATGCWNRRAPLRWRSSSRAESEKHWRAGTRSGQPVSGIARTRHSGRYRDRSGLRGSIPSLRTRASAIEWALSHDETLPAARILAGFSWAYQRLIGAVEASSRLKTVLERLDSTAQPPLQTRAWSALANLSFGSHKVEAAQRALEFAKQCDDRSTTISSLHTIAFGLYQAGRTQEAQPLIDRALRLSKESDLTRSLIHAHVLNIAAAVALNCDRIEEAEKAYAEAFTLYTAFGDELQAMLIRANMADLEFGKGNAAGALELVKAIEAQTRGLRTESTRISALMNGAAYRIALGDIPGARNNAREALRNAHGVRLLSAAIATQHLATVATLSGDARRGAQLRGYVDASYRSIGYQREPTEQCTYDILMTALREELSDAEIESLAAEGAQLSEDQAVAVALTV